MLGQLDGILHKISSVDWNKAKMTRTTVVGPLCVWSSESSLHPWHIGKGL